MTPVRQDSPVGARTGVLRGTARPRTSPAVLAGLVNDGSAVAVAVAAVAEAVERDAEVRFVQVRRPAGDGVDEHVDDATFRAVVRALARHDEVRAVFEVVVGDPVTVLAARSRHPGLLVVAQDRPDARHRVADTLRHLAACPVRVVSAGADAGS